MRASHLHKESATHRLRVEISEQRKNIAKHNEHMNIHEEIATHNDQEHIELRALQGYTIEIIFDTTFSSSQRLVEVAVTVCVGRPPPLSWFVIRITE